ncbi:hypothetical protein EVAR_85432_1 [Eumeta japonica]|uniref:Uncharacterized protein n=1 Tax=Eumeta variegata TaxID=151549 RepID=A0A4C1WK45_EUMVA|nr:hypothetical protein EVAR_85432_1 [Eumeta japonica]
MRNYVFSSIPSRTNIFIHIFRGRRVRARRGGRRRRAAGSKYLWGVEAVRLRRSLAPQRTTALSRRETRAPRRSGAAAGRNAGRSWRRSAKEKRVLARVRLTAHDEYGDEARFGVMRSAKRTQTYWRVWYAACGAAGAAARQWPARPGTPPPADDAGDHTAPDTHLIS